MQIVQRPFSWGGVSDQIEQYLWQCLSKNNIQTVLDIGARDSVMPYIFNQAKIHLFEPMPSSYQRLVQQFETLPNVYSYAYGIGSKDEMIPYYPNTESFIQRTVHTQSRDPILLPMKSFQTVVSELNLSMIDFMKIDTEGGEYAILKNAESYIRNKKIKFIQFEIGGTIFDIKENLFDIFAIFDESWTIYNMELNTLNKMTSAFTWDPSEYSNSNLFATWIPENKLRQMLN
jgi:FkbM family methyltransferase